jgi:acetylornithine aminotransferase
VAAELSKGDFAAVIIEGIQGVAGIFEPTTEFMLGLRELCDKYGCVLILDEIQSGYGRTGKFYAHQHHRVRADIVTMAKGMGNGFPIGGIIISPSIKASFGMLGTTFGGNHLACAAGIAVLEIFESENLVENAREVGEYLMSQLKELPGIKEVRGRGLMIGIEFEEPVKELRRKLLFEQKVFTGASGTNVLRLLPPLVLSKDDVDEFIKRFKAVL